MRVRILRHRSYRVPRWALDGGNGSVVSVEDMNTFEAKLAWSLLKSVVSTFDAYSVDCSEFLALMDSFEEQVTGQFNG